MSKGDFDPLDWDKFRIQAHRMLDASLDKMVHADRGKVWTKLPSKLRELFQQDLPFKGSDTEKLLTEILPYGVGNTHPRFFGWVHGAGSPSGILADIMSASMNVNSGGRDHIGPVVERQVIEWSKQIMGFEKSASGLVVSGTSLATIIALKVARDYAVKDAGKKGIKQGQLIGYTSEQTHSCVKRAFDLLGIGSNSLRLVSCNDAFEIDLSDLKDKIITDRANGLHPFCIIGTAGSVNIGAIDDLSALADIAQSEGIWFHIDGAFGATAIMGNLVKDKLSGMERANSLAFDFHKWFQVNYDAGCILFKDKELHRNSFADRPEYLRNFDRGLAGGDVFWAVDYGPELSRGFRALKVWAHLVEHGVDRIGNSIDRNIKLAQYLACRIQSEDSLQALAPVPLNINCFRFLAKDVDLDDLNKNIVFELQETGIAVPSTTILNGKLAIRVNITNHRTQESDLDILVDAILEIGNKLTHI